ncbi:hypothetical protein [Nocardioides sp.]|uniref:hypothetical protein n=1 Tax=Nocardioides sp. TaxID=35761 RepID=UPI00286B4F40|nr:hypothetical protein [Nocardioides sp.]
MVDPTVIATPAMTSAVPHASLVTEVRVPWWSVLPWAVVLAFGNGFWMVSLRGAAGSIERTSDPFESWLRESTVLVSWYVMAVVVAVALARRRFGSRPRGLGGATGSIGLVVAAGTAAGTIVLVVSSMIDYRLQVERMDHVATVHPACDDACLSELFRSTWHVEAKAVAVGVVLMLATDLALVLLVLALRGGGLRNGLVHVRPVARTSDRHVVLAACLLGAAAVHAAVAPEHLSQWRPAGTFFVLLSLSEVIVGVLALSRRPGGRRAALPAAVVVSVVPLLTWMLSRVTGLPFGPEAWTPEAVGAADAMACLLELTALVLALRLLRTRSPDRTRSRYAQAVAVAAVVTVTTVGVGCSTLPVVGLFPGVGTDHGAEVTGAG